MSPKVSVIFSFYNDAKYLHDSINSVLNQSFQDFELIIIDNGSTDNSFKVANEYAKKDRRIKIIQSQENYFGGSINLTKLLEETNGEYIKLFCADDILIENCLETQINLLEQNSQYIAGFTNMLIVDEDGQSRNKTMECVIKNNRFEYLNYIFYHNSPFTFPSSIVRKSAFTQNMSSDIRLVHFFDVKMWVEILKQGEVFVIEENLVKYRTRNNQGNISNITRSQEKAKAYAFEMHLFYEEFFKIDNFSLFEKIFPESTKYLDKIDKNTDQDLLPIVAAILLYNSEKFDLFYFGLKKNIALLKIFDLIKDAKTLERVKKLGISYHKLRELSNNFLDGVTIHYAGYKTNKIKHFFLGFLAKRKNKALQRMLIKNFKPI